MTWPDDDRDDGRVPDRAGAHDPDVRPVPRGAEEIPAEAEGIRREPDQELALDQEIREVVRQVIRDGDRHQREHEEPGHGARRELIVAHPGHPAGECHVHEPEEERERDEPEGADEREPRVAERHERGVEAPLDARPRRRGGESIEGHRREEDQDERDHRGRHVPGVEEPRAEGAQVPLAASGRGPLEARSAVEARAIPRRAGDLAPPAGLAVRDAHLGRGESRQDPEGCGERVGVAQPGDAAEEGHASPRERRVGDDQVTELGGDAPARVDQLDPGEREEQRDRRPDAESRRVAEPQRPPSEQRLAPREERGPGIDDAPTGSPRAPRGRRIPPTTPPR